MAAVIEVKYFNTFWLKKTIWKDGVKPATGALDAPSYGSAWPGLPWNPYSGSSISSKIAYPTGASVDPSDDQKYNYVIEESRIRGGFNNVSTDYGAKAYLVEKNKNSINRFNSLIYSGVYNSITELNETNVFNPAESITKSVDPDFGSIQRLYSEDTNLIIFQENKVNKALIDKDAIYSAEGGGSVTSSNLVIGQIVPYLGEYGISRNPESFAVFGFRKYFTDKDRSAILRLSRDGITEISQYGMRDFFRDELAKIQDEFNNFQTTSIFANIQDPTTPPPTGTPPPLTGFTQKIKLTAVNLEIEPGMIFSYAPPGGSPIQTSALVDGVSGFDVYLNEYLPTLPANAELFFTKAVKDKAEGGFDTYNDVYLLSLQQPKVKSVESDIYKTLSFDENSQGWVSFYDFMPTNIVGFKNNLFTTTSSQLWLHNSNLVNKNSFYGSSPFNSSVTFVFNANPSITKNFKTVSYEGSNGWEIQSIVSSIQGVDNSTDHQDETNFVKSYDEGKYTDGSVIYRSGFNRKENRYVANLINASSRRPGEVIFNNSMSGIKGYFAVVKISTDGSTDLGGAKELFAVSSNFVTSSQ